MRDPESTARDFYQAYRILSENNERVRKEIQSDNPLSVSPRMMKRIKGGDLKQSLGADVVCLAFALELYLKAILFHSVGQRTKSHNLHELFRAIPEQTRNQIHEEMLKQLPNKGALEFDEALREIASAFDEWRYVFETGSASFRPSFGLALAEALAEVVKRLRVSRSAAHPVSK